MLYCVTEGGGGGGGSKVFVCGMHLNRKFIITFFIKVFMFNLLLQRFNLVILTHTDEGWSHGWHALLHR
jgi:hypothetical protein